MIRTLQQEKEYEITPLCTSSGILRCSYFKWLHREESAGNTLWLEESIRLYNEVKGICGCRRVMLNVNSWFGRNYNRKRLNSLMRSVHMQAVIRRNKKHYIMAEPRLTAENILNRKFTADGSNQKWLTGVTEFKLQGGQKAYLSARLDFHARNVVAYMLEGSNNNQLVFDTFAQAVKANPDAHPLFHSDRECQYINRQFKAKLDSIRAQQRAFPNRPMY